MRRVDWSDPDDTERYAMEFERETNIMMAFTLPIATVAVSPITGLVSGWVACLGVIALVLIQSAIISSLPEVKI